MKIAAARALAIIWSATLALALLAPTNARAAGPSFGQPSATAVLGEPVTIVSTISADDVASVDVLLHQIDNPTTIVLPADQISNNTWQAAQEIDISTSAGCSCLAQGQSAPNTHFDFQFRVTASDGSTSLGPVGQSTVEDNRFTWQVLEDRLIRFHWYAGDQAFAASGAAAANDAISKATQALGVTIDEPFDMFVYDTEEAMRTAVSPNRENVQAEAHPDIDTIFAWLPSNQPADEYNRVVIAHELTHLVFHHVVDNPYAGVPRWLDEGTAVYMSEGYTSQWQGYVNGAVQTHSLIPLQGLGGLFPSVTAEFYIAYAESVAAVDYFIRTYGEPKFWELVHSYATGVADDEAFTAAIGTDLAGFNTAWFSSLSLTPPDPVGPQPGAPGPVPSSWTQPVSAPGTPSFATPAPTGAPGSTPTGTDRETARPVGSPSATNAPDGVGAKPTDVTSTLIVLGVVIMLIIVTVVIGVVVLNRRAGPPPPPPNYPF